MAILYQQFELFNSTGLTFSILIIVVEFKLRLLTAEQTNFNCDLTEKNNCILSS